MSLWWSSAVAVIDAGLVVHGRPPSASARSRPGTPGSAGRRSAQALLEPGWIESQYRVGEHRVEHRVEARQIL